MKDVEGMTFVDLLIIATCFSLLMSVVIPFLQASKGSERIEDLALSAGSRVKAIEAAVVQHDIENYDSLDGGSFGIPADLTATSTLHGASVTNGEILLTWKKDATFMEGVTYTLRPQKLSHPLEWGAGGSCVMRGFC
ncbi:MAG: hypothetical protein R3F50_19035 [Gammaproteobacteria bacterium]